MEYKDVQSYGGGTCVSVQGHVKKVCQDEIDPLEPFKKLCINFQSDSPFSRLRNYVLIFKVTVYIMWQVTGTVCELAN